MAAAILLAPALAGGCAVQACGADGRVLLRILSDGPVGQAVGVSMITSSPPVNYIWAMAGMYKDLKTDWAISVESIWGNNRRSQFHRHGNGKQPPRRRYILRS